MVPVPVVMSGIQLMVQAAAAESAARRAEDQLKLEAFRIKAFAADREDERWHQRELAELQAKTQVQLRQIQVDAATQAAERQAKVLHRFLDIQSNFADRKLDFLKETFAATRDMLAEGHKQLLDERTACATALLSPAVSGPKETMIRARQRELDDQIAEVQRAQGALSAAYGKVIALLDPGIAANQTVLAALPPAMI